MLIDAATVPFSLRNSDRQLEECFLRNYVPTALESYRQLNRIKRVLLIDNYHQLKLSARAKVDLLNKFREHSFRIIVFAHDLELTFQDLSEGGEDGAGELPFTFYSILPFSYVQQNRLLEKWLLLGGDADRDTSLFVSNLEKLRRTLDTLVAKTMCRLIRLMFCPFYRRPKPEPTLTSTQARTDTCMSFLYQEFYCPWFLCSRY